MHTSAADVTAASRDYPFVVSWNLGNRENFLVRKAREPEGY